MSRYSVDCGRDAGAG